MHEHASLRRRHPARDRPARLRHHVARAHGARCAGGGHRTPARLRGALRDCRAARHGRLFGGHPPGRRRHSPAGRQGSPSQDDAPEASLVALPKTSDVVIVGAGAVGTGIAYHLARRGQRRVVVLEQDAVGSGTTSKAAGGIRAQFSTETEIRISLECIKVFEHFEDEFGVDIGYRKIGYLSLITDEADLRGYEPRIALQNRLGVDVRVITPKEAQVIVPAMRVDDLIAAVWSPGDGMAGPAEVTNAFARRARELGAVIVEGVEVTGIDLKTRVVRTSQGEITAPTIVNAAGPRAARVARMVGVDVAVHPRRRHIFFTEPFPEIPGPTPLTTDRGSGMYFRKEMEQLLISPGDVVDVGDDMNVALDAEKRDEAVEKAIHRLPILERARIAGGWAGLRPLTPDEHAIIGWAPGVEGFFLAVGFCGHGFQHSPATGRLVADWLVDGRPPMDLSVFDPNRFA
ncbi:MAG: FAD-binding oxidoreductase [Candidatus Rokubacteria bacterium]|nr:FAD-binding oxidoreductase [Candidatus Rokubacteria bacterium]